MRSKTTLLASLLAVLLSGCGTTAGPEIKIVDTGCDWTRPIYMSRADILTDGSARQILAHNETGAARCGWKRNNAKPKAPPAKR